MARDRPRRADGVEQMQRRLDELGDEIEKTRREAQDRGLLPDGEEDRYYESGEIGGEYDDQSITPPG